MTGALNPINGFIITLVGTGANNTITVADFLAMKVAFDKANVPLGGRVAIVDPITAASPDCNLQLTANITDFGRTLVLDGFGRDREYLMKYPRLARHHLQSSCKGAFGNGTTTVANGVANVFMSVADDNTKPVMQAWRRMPSIETERNKDLPGVVKSSLPRAVMASVSNVWTPSVLS